MNSYTRTLENAKRLALVRAASQSIEAPAIDPETALWAAELAKLLSDRMHTLAKQNVAANTFHAECLRAKKYLMAAGNHQMLHSTLLKKMRLNNRIFREIMETLIAQNDISSFPSEGGRGVVYQLIEAD